MGKMKIVIYVIVILCVAAGGFLYFSNEKKTDNLEKAMTTASKDYFNDYMSAGTGANAYKVTLAMLEEANDSKGESYKLNELKGCDKEKTYAMVSFDYDSGKATSVEVILDCK